MANEQPTEYELLPIKSMNCIVPIDGRINNLRSSIMLNLPKFFDRYDGENVIQTQPIAIVGGGPSLRKTRRALSGYPGRIMACGSAHDYLLKHEIVPHYAINLDPDKRMPEFFSRKHTSVEYLIASHCDPALFAHLSDCNVVTWHAAGEAPHDAIHGEDTIANASTVLGSAFPVTYLMGYRAFDFFGADSCFASKYDQNADRKYPDKNPDILQVRVTGSDKKFYSCPQLLSQSQQFMDAYRWFVYDRGCKVTVHGESLTAEHVRVFEQQVAATKAAKVA